MTPSTTTAVAPRDKTEVEFLPFGSEDKIKLSIGIVKSFVANPTKSGTMPSDRDCMKFVMLCRSRRLNPFEGDAFLLGYDTKEGPQFSLITAHQAFLKRAECHPEYDGMESGVIVRMEEGQILDREGDFYLEGETVIGGWATVYFKSRKYPMKKRVRLKTFQKPYGVWQTDPAGMICKVSEADALRSSFPTMLGGMYLREEFDAGRTSEPPDMPEAKVNKALFQKKPKTEVTVAPASRDALAGFLKEHKMTFDALRLLCEEHPRFGSKIDVWTSLDDVSEEDAKALLESLTVVEGAVELP